ncbi:MAG: TetR/AcrR family transcriptional regulator [Burkholderiaceae bacterium]|nr:TetR/AcrR family transcriptional regulator [Burkholderiaceae bacterium]
MPAPLPRRRKPVRRDEILAAAREVFLERSFENASVAEIAARAGCVEGTIYTYFRSKRELLDSLLVAFYDRLIADVEAGFDAIVDTRARLSYLIARHLQVAIDDPAFARLIVRESRGHRPYFGSQLHALNRRYGQFLMRTLRDGIERGELRGDLDAALARDLVFGGLEHHVWNRLARRRNFVPARTATTIVELLWNGWTAPDGGDLRGLEQRVQRLERRIDPG